jgi:hypothetical protein
MLEWMVVRDEVTGRLGMNLQANAPEKSHLQVQTVPSRALPSVPQPVLGEVHFPGAGQPPIVLLDRISFVMDRLFAIPGTRQRLGLNTILLLVPGLGDIIPSLVGVLILIVGLRHYQVPRIVATRMVLNTFLDAALGWIPILGDLFNLFFKADTRNVRLLQEHAGQSAVEPRAARQHWAFVVGALLFVVLLCTGLVLGTAILIRWMNQTISQMFGGL